MGTQNMRLKWKKDTYSIPTPDGVYLRGNNRRLVLKGKSLYRLLERLAPTLDGEVTLAEITDGLDADRKRMVTHLLEKLTAHHFLQDTSQDQLHGLNQAELETYAPNLTFIESLQTSAPSRFERFRNQRLLLIGSGPALTSLFHTSLQAGVKQVSAFLTSEDASDSHFPQDLLAARADTIPEGYVQFITTAAWDDEAEARKIIQAYDVVLHLGEQPALARARLLNRLCIEEQKTLLQAIIMDEHAWVGPLVCPETGNCWECAWRRLQANLSDSSSYAFLQHQLPVSGGRSLIQTEVTLIVNQLLFVLFQHMTQTSVIEKAGQLSVIDLNTCLSESHAFLPHPHCQAGPHPGQPAQHPGHSSQYPVALTAAQFLEQMHHLQQRDSIEPGAFLADIAKCVDKRFGLFSALEHEHFVQVPLAVWCMQLSNPMREEIQPGALSVIAAATDARSAGIRVAQKACERYAANMMDQRRLLAHEMAAQGSWPVMLPDQWSEHAPDSEMWSWGLDLHTQQAVLVPATCVFSSLSHDGCGVAAGMSWDEALCQGLLDWCHKLTVEQVQGAQQPYQQVDLAKALLTPEDQHLVRLLRAVGQLTVYDVSGSLRVPTFAICVDEKVVAYSTHCDAAQALRSGIERTLQQYQSEHFQQDEYTVAPVPDLPMHLRSEHLVLPSYALPDAWADRLAWLLQSLQASGFRAFAVPLDHDPALAQVCPFIVRVLVRCGELEKGAERV